MKQLVQPTGGGPVLVVDVPRPVVGPTEVLVRAEATLISAGTERAVTQLAQKNLFDKARARPDLVRQVVQKAKNDGVGATMQAVRSRLADDVALGYSGAGVVVEIGSAVEGIAPGQRVATAGQGYASHAEYQRVPSLLCSTLPEGLDSDDACFATVASIGLHGLRQADIGPGSRVIVVGLGLIGQLTTRLALASGCSVAGIDIRQDAVKLADAEGALGLVERGAATTEKILEWSRGRGADAVIITAGATGDSNIITSVPARCRDRASVVVVGDIGLDLVRNDWYRKELQLHVPRSYGPGRYDRSYEEWGVDYPVGQVRWTEGRNLEAVLDLLAGGRLTVSDLVTHRYDVEHGDRAYEALDDPAEAPLAIVIGYPDRPGTDDRTVHVAVPNTKTTRALPAQPRIGVLGAGLFVRSTILPALAAAEVGSVTHIASASGLSAARVAERSGIAKASSGAEEVLNDDVDVVVIATPHSTHAELTTRALDAGKQVYCEKPLALSIAELDAVEAAYQRNDGRLLVGFNRRYSPMVREIARRLGQRGSGPINLIYRVNAGPLPEAHWYGDRREGGRLLGEVCHFVDTCNFLAGDQEVLEAHCARPAGFQHDSYTVMLRYADGSTASIVYAAGGHPGTAKEHIEVLGRNSTFTVDNFRRLLVDGDKVGIASGKGHHEMLGAQGWAGDHHRGALTAFATTRLTLRLADVARWE